MRWVQFECRTMLARVFLLKSARLKAILVPTTCQPARSSYCMVSNRDSTVWARRSTIPTRRFVLPPRHNAFIAMERLNHAVKLIKCSSAIQGEEAQTDSVGHSCASGTPSSPNKKSGFAAALFVWGQCPLIKDWQDPSSWPPRRQQWLPP